MSASSEVTVRPAESRDEARWRSMWAGYCRFYERDMAEAVTQHTWGRISDPASPVYSIVAEQAEDLAGTGSRVIGMCNYILHENTWHLEPVCYLEDLYVEPSCRARGVGRSLIDWVVAAMREQGWGRVYWHTKENNYRARGLYDHYVPHSGFVRYVVFP